MWKLAFSAAWALLLSTNAVFAFEYKITSAGTIGLTDNATGIEDLATLFLNQPVKVSLSDIEWELAAEGEFNTTNSTFLRWVTTVDDQVQASGIMDLSELETRELPLSLEAGVVMVETSGRHTIQVDVTVEANDSSESTSQDYQAYAAGVSLIPLIVVLVLAMTTHMVELSLFATVFLGACMVAGDLKMGFKSTLDVYILNALADKWHGYVYLFTMFLSGLVAMMERSGGMAGLVKAISKYVTSSRSAQAATFTIGILVFFDDYANTLLAGETMRPLTDLLFVSREKLAFIVDATAAPIASITPISSWVGFEVGLIQDQLDQLVGRYGAENLTVKTSGLAVFLESIKYRYYPIFMLILMPLLIATKRDFGPMLIAERKVQVYQRKDGGDGKGPAGKLQDATGGGKQNEPRSDTPEFAYNMAVPITLLVFFIFYLLIMSGDDGSGEQTFMDKMENADSYAALLWGTMATTMLITLFYSLQIVHNGKLIVPTPAVMKAMWIDPWFDRANRELDISAEEAEEVSMDDAERGAKTSLTDPGSVPIRPRSLMSIKDCVESFLYGLGRIFPALIVLTLAWASGAIMVSVGADRLFSAVITGGIPPESLPTLSFIISVFMALATGTSWGTMTILFPLVCVPTYEASGGDARIFYAVIAGILSGSVAGDHMSPISDTTVLSSLASDCQLINHVSTQAPYAFVTIILAILFGTLPIGNGAWPNIVGILLGAVTIGLFVFAICVPVLSPTGRWDPFTWLRLKLKKADDPLYKLQQDTISAADQFTQSSDNVDESFVPNEKAKEETSPEPRDTMSANQEIEA